MVDPYMGAAHRSERGREQARAFKGPTVGFVAPPTQPFHPFMDLPNSTYYPPYGPNGEPLNPYKFVPPAGDPPPPPVGAGGAGGAAFGPLAVVGLVAGFGLGWWATEDVREWKRGHYRPSKVYRGYPKYDPLFSFNQDVDRSKYYDPYMLHWVNDQGGLIGGWSHPDWDIWNPCGGFGHPCPDEGAYKFKMGNSPNYCVPSCVGVNDDGSLFDTPRAAFDAAPSVLPMGVHRVKTTSAGKIIGVGHASTSKLLGTWADSSLWTQAGGVVLLDEGVYGHATTVDEGEPSLDDLEAPARLSRGRMSEGYSVPFSLSHPFTVIRVAPGSPSVGVPDQVIDPEEGTVTIHPPGQPPGNPNDEAQRERKPTPNRIAHLGFVAINVVTETQDFMEALHKGLPKRLRSKPRKGGDVPPWVIAQDIWDHWDDWDAEVALEAFVNNQIEDAIYGRFFAQQAAAQRRLGVTAGLARGTRVYRPGGEPITLPVPEVHFANGEHSVSLGNWTYDPVSGRLTEGE